MSEIVSSAFAPRHVLDIDALTKTDVEQILSIADTFYEVSRRPVRKVPTLRGKTIINLFFEPSTRTRTSFEIAGKRLSADVINISGSSSSQSKGETLLDTCKTLQSMHPDVVIIRHSASGAPHFVAKHIDARIVNAGDGMHQHPTQALLDAFALRRKRGSLDKLVVVMCGDIAHSRVVRSNIQLLRLFGAEIRLVGPRTLMPPAIEGPGVTCFDQINPALAGADVVMALRIQRERLHGTQLPTVREYARVYGITSDRLKLAKPDVIVMHPGPMNRGVEISPEVADGPNSIVLGQVEAGVAVRMAVLYLLAAEAGSKTMAD